METRRMHAAKTSKTTKQTFPGRLNYINQRYATPVTSTPKRVTTTVTKEDVDTCFGFDASDDRDRSCNYSVLISPISTIPKNGETPRVRVNNAVVGKERDEGFNALLTRHKKVHEDKDKDVVAKPKKKQTSVQKKPVNHGPPAKSKSKRTRAKRAATAVTKENIDTTWEHDNSDDKNCNYSALISPISSLTHNVAGGNERNEDFNALLERYGKVEPDDENEIHFDSAKLKKTYVHKKSENYGPPVFAKLTKPKRKSRKRSVVNHGTEKSDSDDDDHEDPETKKWLEQKKKEFDDVLHVPLLVTRPQGRR